MTNHKPQLISSAPIQRDTIILQCLAALLIANSHLEGLYPHSWMAADGLIGNSLFFFLSGYGLVRSEQKNHRPFINYYQRRILRIYPSLWLVIILFQLGLGETWRSWTTENYVKHFIYPTEYGYIRQIMFFYIPFFFLARWQRPRLLMGLCLGLMVPYLVRYVMVLPPGGIIHLKLGLTDSWLWDIFYFQLLLVGGFCGFHPGWRLINRDIAAVWLLAVALVTYVGFKFAMVVNGAFIPGTSLPLGDFFIVLNMLTILIVLLMFQVTTSSLVASWVGSIAPLKWFVILAGGVTLEIYLCHEFIAYNAVMNKIPFPANIVIWLAVTLVVSWVIGKLARHFQRLFAKP